MNLDSGNIKVDESALEDMTLIAEEPLRSWQHPLAHSISSENIRKP